MLRRLTFITLLVAATLLGVEAGRHYDRHWDVSMDRAHSLTEPAEAALTLIGDGLRFTAFVADLPVQRAEIRAILAPYLAHSAQPQLNFIDPIESPDQARAHEVSRNIELHLQIDQRKEVIGQIGRPAIDAALNRLARQGDRWIVALRGHGEADLGAGPGGLLQFARHVERLGYRMLTLDPRQIRELPDNTALLLVAGPHQDYQADVEAQILRYLDDGGSLLWLFEEIYPAWMIDRLGLHPLPGLIVDADAARYGRDSPAHAVITRFPKRLPMPASADHALLYRARAISVEPPDSWQQQGLLSSGANSWNETGGLRGTISRNPEHGEHAGPLAAGVLLQPADPGESTRIVVMGGRHWLGNDQIGQAGNLQLAVGLIRWLTDNERLPSAAPNPGLAISDNAAATGWLALLLMLGLPMVFVGYGWWHRARRRRQ
jgi:hypothetical protein